ncbi:MAG TPA: phosphate acetyltransferase, partial [Erysipelotrichaceae bacterium]|nr:phosphate acetyltransferase [Erysipelotrichaceae bacterium]
MIIDKLEEKIRGKNTKIVFTEGWDPRVQKAAIELAAKDVIVPILLGEKDEIDACAQEHGFDISNI